MPMTDPLLETGASPPDSAHYLRAVTDMAERCAVVTQDAIYSDNGIKLVEKGARIDSRLYDRLVQHKLREPIDSHLTVENAVDAPALMAAAKELLATAPLPRKAWEKDTIPNLTGTIHAYRPKGAIARGGERQRATGDYEAWTPE